MKCCRRYLCVLLCLALLLGGSSLSVSAATLPEVPIKVMTQTSIVVGGNENALDPFTFYPGNGTNEVNNSRWQNVNKPQSGKYYFYVYSQDGQPLVPEGEKTTVTLQDAYISFLADGGNGDVVQPGDLVYGYGVGSIFAQIIYANGSSEYWTASAVQNNFECDLKATGTPKDDVKQIIFIVSTSFNTPELQSLFNKGSVMIMSYMGEYKGDDRYNLKVVQPSEEEGLLSGILGWCQNIFNSIGEGFDSIGEGISNLWGAVTQGFTDLKNGIANLWTAISELPSKIWSFIENGLKSLFVPTEEEIIASKDRWEQLLSSKLGAIWQVVDITLESWDKIQSYDEQNTIDMPKVEIPLPDDNKFEFGGQEVPVVPQGFEAIATICKTVCGAICSLMFVNGLRKRYDEVMGVEQ